MPRTTFSLQLSPGCRLRTIVFSHGWFDLPPFAWDERTQTLGLVARAGEAPVSIDVRQSSPERISVHVRSPSKLGKSDRDQLAWVLRKVLGLDLAVEEFYALAGAEYEWARRLGCGPFLRGTSVFEDVVKMVATTNCSWSLTRQMVRRLVAELGEDAPGDRKAFPTPEAMAARPASFYREVVRAGYRAEAFRELARRVAGGEVDVEAWANYAGPTSDLVREMRRERGIGPYAAENLCRLLGRFDGLGLDSWCLKKFPRVHPVRGDVSKAIARRYRRFGRWQGLALWLDLTKDWHGEGALADQTTAFAKQ